MKKIVTLLVVIVVILLVSMIDFLPWWSFLIPVFLLGVFLPLKKWEVPAFLLGVFAGFLVWTLSTLYFELTYNGEILQTTAELMNVPYLLLYFIIGLIGGVLSGLALYSGYLLRKGREILNLELPGDRFDNGS